MSEPGIKIALLAPPPAVGIDDAADNPLARATKNLLEEGQGFTRAANAIVRDATTGREHWLGMFVRTAASRLLFFPGFVERYDRMQGGGDQSGRGQFDRALSLDHLTLEPDLRTWHFTQRTRRARSQGGPATLDVGHDRALWFGMTTSGLADLRETRGETIARAPPPRNDDELRRRVESFLAAVNGAGLAHLDVSGDSTGQALHFAVVVGRPGSPTYTGPNIAVPPNGPGVTLHVKGSLTSNGRHALLPLADVELQILALRIPGSVTDGITFTAPA
jgi:hypothetical protein